AVERKGLPVLLRAFEALREHVPATLTLVGADPREVAHMALEDRGITALGKVSEQRKLAELERADVLCAPSLRGESFGMVLTEAFASSTAARARPPRQACARATLRYGLVPSDLEPRIPAQRLPKLQAAPPAPAGNARLRALRRGALVLSWLAGVGVAALALERVGVPKVAASLVASKPGLLVAGLALMCASMFARA